MNILEGITIADFSRVLAGPDCPMWLADLGATVLKIESPQGDDTRHWKPPTFNDASTYYLSVNRNKQSILLDLNNPDDLKHAHRIVEQSDFLIENFKPGGLKKFGLHHSQTLARHPQLIHAQISGFGSEEGAHLPGYDLLVQALSGFMHVTGDPDGPPQRGGIAIFDVVAGLNMATAICAALYERERSGQGQHIEVDLLTSALPALVNQTSGAITCGNDPMRSHPHRARRRATRPSTRARSRDNHRRHPPDTQPRNLQPYPR